MIATSQKPKVDLTELARLAHAALNRARPDQAAAKVVNSRLLLCCGPHVGQLDRGPIESRRGRPAQPQGGAATKSWDAEDTGTANHRVTVVALQRAYFVLCRHPQKVVEASRYLTRSRPWRPSI